MTPPLPDALRCTGVSLRYPEAARDAVGPVSLRLRAGERRLLLGPSGSGKSTLLHSLTGLIPASIPGERRGEVALFGRPSESRRPADWADSVAILFQDADQTLAGFTVADEIAFALENRELPPAVIAESVRAALRRAGLPPDWTARRIGSLSGGQRQMVALAAILAQAPKLILADEPTASLAPAAARLAAELLLAPGQSVLIVDHRLGPVLDRIDGVSVLNRQGQMLAEGSPQDVFGSHGGDLDAQGIWTPLAVRVRLALAKQGHALPQVWRMEDLLPHLPLGLELSRLVGKPPAPLGPPILRLERAACAPPDGPVVVAGIDLTLNAGEVLGILGPNGAGKSTLGACLAGLLPLRTGRRSGPAGAMAFQNPEAHFVTDSVQGELVAMGATPDQVRAGLAQWSLTGLADQHPYTLSMGQKRRLALAALTAARPWPVLVLDEPTSGLDHAGSFAAARQIAALAARGQAVVVITHDADFALSVCDRIVLLADGGIVADGPPALVLRDAERLERHGLARPEAAALLDLGVPC
ncbi:ABC transporter ATP-binding protein [Tabrizicola aquatica]|uniref:ABC transporter ATP-binding protein n=1 Tax=Tabrizicola aquatica TaxID=909926 RepID=UPI000CD03C60|nr:ABC transporter ATP-binding protein [Tabrizicola aquatica]